MASKQLKSGVKARKDELRVELIAVKDNAVSDRERLSEVQEILSRMITLFKKRGRPRKEEANEILAA